MQASEFCYWLQGYFELSGGEETISKEQAKAIKRHLDLVFVHDLDPKQVAEKLQQIHDGTGKNPNEHMTSQSNNVGLFGEPIMRC